MGFNTVTEVLEHSEFQDKYARQEHTVGRNVNFKKHTGGLARETQSFSNYSNSYSFSWTTSGLPDCPFMPSEKCALLIGIFPVNYASFLPVCYTDVYWLDYILIMPSVNNIRS